MPKKSNDRKTPSAIDGRVQRSKAVVLGTTLELLTESGLGGLSVDEVSRRSGVAKTTIYRHWPTRTDLVLDACAQINTQHAVPDTGSFKGDITALLVSMAQMLSTARWPSVMPSMLDAAERNPDLAEVHGRIQLGHTVPFEEVMERAKRRGELPSSTDSSAITALLLGPLYYRRWFSREPLDDAFVNGILEAVLP